MTDGTPPREPHAGPESGHDAPNGGFSFGKLAFYALGSGVLCLAVAVPVVVLCAQWSPIAGLVAALVALAAMITVIGTVATRVVDRARDAMLASQESPRQTPTDRRPD